ncbi:MAG: TonB-dependent receptor domain-containing protein, partial [Salibacteraceae bacterium]
WNFNLSAGRLFTNLRSDANGRPFREETVDQILDPRSVVTDPVTLFNPEDSVIFVFPGDGLVNNGGIATQWHDHYAQEYTVRTKMSYYPKNKLHTFSIGFEHKELEYQWVDVTRPWVGAPIKINDTLSTASISIGSSNDIWKVNPANGGVFLQDILSYKGINATIGVRFNYWAYGKFVDDAVENPDALVLDQVRDDYRSETSKIFGRRWKARFLPKLNISFPVTENYVLYFNYGHSMKLPHPRFIYAGLDPVFQDRSFLSRLGNPNLKPEATVSYEIGLKSQITRDLGLTLTAFNNDKYDYIVTRTIVIEDQTGRLVDKTFNINQDYAKIVGIELGIAQRIGKHFRAFFNGAYQVATGKSNSAAESLLQIRQTGFVNTTQEQPLAWDRPWDLKLGLIFTPDTNLRIGRIPLHGFRVFASSTYKSGLRYTPYEQTGTTDLGRPIYQVQADKPFSEIGKAWFWTDIKISRDFLLKNQKGISLSIEIRNIFDARNSQLINPVTGEAYKAGDPLPIEDRDPFFPDPQDRGLPPTNPARFLPPRQILYGLTFSF